jgi:hypothetical protein
MDAKMKRRAFCYFILCLALAAACTPTNEVSIQPTMTSDACAGATESSAREHFTFSQITPCLNTPEKMIMFVLNNMQWQPDYDETNFGENVYLPVEEVYKNGADDCDGMAEFIACVLNKNGYEAYNVGISVNHPWGFNVAGYIGENGKMYAIINKPQPDGPFDTWEELAQVYIDAGLAEPDGIIWLFQPCLESRVDGDAVLALKHQVVR